MPTPEVREYPKTALRALLLNPNADVSDEKKISAAPKKSYKRFYQEVNPVVEIHCAKLISLEAFKRVKIVPKKVVKILFEKLL